MSTTAKPARVRQSEIIQVAGNPSYIGVPAGHRLTLTAIGNPSRYGREADCGHGVIEPRESATFTGPRHVSSPAGASLLVEIAPPSDDKPAPAKPKSERRS